MKGNNLGLPGVRKTGLLRSAIPWPMKLDSYWYLASKSKIVRISPGSCDCLRWSVFLNDQLICDSYGSAEEAALSASRRDFSTELAVRIFSGVTVPSDINMWRTIPPELPGFVPQENHSRECKGHTRRWNHKRS